MELWINCFYVHRNEDGQWAATLKWNSNQVNILQNIQGRLHGDFKGEVSSQYFEETLEVAVNKVYELAKYMNITEHDTMKPVIYYTDDETLLTNFPTTSDAEKIIELENAKRMWI